MADLFMNYRKWNEMGIEEEDAELVGYLTDIKNKHLDYLAHRQSIRKDGKSLKCPSESHHSGGVPAHMEVQEKTDCCSQDSKRPSVSSTLKGTTTLRVAKNEAVDQFRHELDSITARGQFLAEEARASIAEIRRNVRSRSWSSHCKEPLEMSCSDEADALRASLMAKVDAEIETAWIGSNQSHGP